ncbi:MAG: VWA domain-containing protein, partial [Bauldia sp.]
MTFLAPLWLLAAALGVAVLLLHAARRRTVAVPSLQLWRSLDAGNARRKVRRPPLTPSLLLQLLAVLLAALALAQPRLGPAAVDHYVFVIDGSASMRTADGEGGSRFEAARADLARVIRAIAADGDVRVSVVRAGATPVLVAARQSWPAGILPLVAALRPGDDVVDWPKTMAAIPALVGEAASVRVTILTDDAAAAGAAASVLGPPIDAAIVRYGRSDTPDAALTARIMPVDAAAGRWRVEGTITLTGGAAPPSAVSVAFAPGAVGELLDWPPIAVRPPRDAAEAAPGVPQAVPFGAELTLPGAGRLMLSLAGDAAPQDDAVFFTVLGPPLPLRVAIVGAPDERLVRAIEAAGPAEIRAADQLTGDLADVDLVVVTTGIDRRPTTNVLWLGAGRVAGEPAPALLADSDPTSWNAAHPLSRNVDWAALAGPPAQAVAPLPGAEIVVAAGEAPLVAARTTASGRDVRVALDLGPGGFADEPTFPVFIGNLIDWLGPDFGRETGRACVAGIPCRLASRELAARITAPDGSLAWQGATVAGPLPRGLDAAFLPVAAGFYTVTRADGTLTTIAVNAAADAVAARGEGTGALPMAPLRLAPWLAAAAFIALLAEAIVAGRGAERFLRGASLWRGAPGSGRRRAILGLRIATLAAIAAALLALPLPAREPAETVFAVVAPAAGAAAAEAAAFAAEAAHRAGDGRVVAVSAAATGPASGTDLEGAIRLAAALLPADRAGRIVVASDGNETVGAIGAAAPSLVARGIPLDAVPLPAMPPGEVLVTRVEAARNVRAGDSVPLAALIHAESPVAAEIAILRDGAPVATETKNLETGWNRLDTTVPLVAARTLVEVAVAAAGDVEPGNNRAGVVLLPGVAPRVLVLSSDREWGAFFAAAIAAQNIEAEVIAPDRAPRDLAGWLAWDVVVLMNVPALALATAQQELLDDAVGIHGRGLVILGGENAFGPGGYYATPLERLSPLSSRVPQETPRAAIVFVLDRSGSMQAPVDDVTRLDIAKEATLGAVALLPGESDVGIVVFDSEAQVLVPMQPSRDEAAVAAALAPVAPGGGTELFPALTTALALLSPSTAATRHIVVITDGLVEPVDFTGLI